MRIPSDRNWTQTNESDSLGVLNETKNITIEAGNKIISTRKPYAHLHTDGQANLGYILAINYYDSDYIAVTTNEAFRFSLSTNSATEIASAPNFAQNSDAVICYNRLYTSINTNLSYYDGSSWTNSIETLITDVPHPLEVFDSLTTYKLAVGNGSVVLLIDLNGNDSGTFLTIPAQFQVTTMRYRNGYLYVGTRNIYGGEARIFVWNGSGSNAQYEIPTGASWVFSMTPYLSTVACMLDTGQLILINGSTPQELAALPVYYTPNVTWQGSGGLQVNGKVFNRGMATVGDNIYINIDGDCDLGINHQMKSGLWVYSPNNGLWHTAQSSNDRLIRDTGFSVTNSIFTTSATHYLKTGDAVQFTTVSGLSGDVDEGVPYYVKVESTTTFKLALSRKALQAEEYITVSGTMSGDVLLYVQNRDVGVQVNTSAGAIGLITSKEAPPEIFAGDVMFGSRVTDLEGDNKYTIQLFSNSYSVSSATTQKIYTDNIKQNWKKLYGFLSGCLLDNEEIVVKYKNSDELGYPTKVFEGVWLSENQINTASDTRDEFDWSDIEIGDEITLVNRYGRGYSAHVTAKETAALTTTLTIDESIGTANESVYLYADNFKKLGVVNNQRQDKNFFEVALMNIASPWVQLKLEMRGFQIEIDMLDLANAVNQSSD